MKFIKPFQLFEEVQVGEDNIHDLEKYLADMESSMTDKLFWLDKVDCDVIVDFGCADGAMLEKLSRTNPGVKLIGYDIDDSMLSKARSRLTQNVQLSNDWYQVLETLKDYQRPMVFLSSVIHEVYSYSHPKQVNQFWKQIFSGDFQTVVIRDMLPSVKTGRYINEEDVQVIKQRAKPEVVRAFEEEWGSIGRDYRNLLHFLLKYRYEENFDREMKENYVPVSLETVLKKVPDSYSVTYDDHYVLPYLRNIVRKDFGIEIKESTHAKLIIEKK